MQLFRPEWLNGFWIVAGLVLMFLWRSRRKKKILERFGDPKTVDEMRASHSPGKERLKTVLTLLMISLLILTLARPQWGEIKKEITKKGVEIIFLVDTSLSMLAEDVSPDRIGRAKIIMRAFLRQFRGDRVGIVTFAGSGFIQSPLTVDYDAFMLFSNSIQVGSIPDLGTSLREGVETAIRAFPESRKKNHVIIILSDGEDMEGQMEQAFETAKSANVRIYSIGIGTPQGAPIPLRAEKGKITGYKKDHEGQVVITILNDVILKQLAEKTGGLYLEGTSGREAEWVYQHMQNIEKEDFKHRKVAEKEDYFQFFLLLAVLLAIWEFLTGDTVRQRGKT